MDTTFAYDTRVLMCSGCGAPLEAAVQGGSFDCTYCGAANQVTARVEQPVFSASTSAPADEDERLRRLRAQDGMPLLPPDSLKALVGPDGNLPEWKIQEAVQIWQSARREVATTSNFEAAERLLYLTLALSNHFSAQDDLLRQRAMFESALEVFFLPRHRQMMRGYLARCAARAGDLEAAERWLAPCDTRSDDLDTDSAYRFSRAFIDTARGEFKAVLGTLGHRLDEVPLMDAVDTVAAVFRANAWERLGQTDRAVALLKETMGKGGANARRSMKQMIERYADWELCQGSYAQAEASYRQAASVAAGKRASGGVGIIILPIGCLMLLVAIGLVGAAAVCLALTLFAGADLGEAVGGMGITGVSLLIPGLIMSGVGFRLRAAAKKARRLRQHGVSAYGEVTAVRHTGTKINDVPIVEIRLRVQLEGHDPVDTSAKMLLGAAEVALFQIGRTVPVKVDPDDPTQVVIETS